MSTHIRIPKDVSAVIGAICQPGGLYPKFASRSAAHVATELIRESPTFRDAQKQAAAEQHPRPGAKKR